MPANHTEIEKRLWDAADELRANSKLKASEYSVPVLGLIFLRQADQMFGEAEKRLKRKSTGRRKMGKIDFASVLGCVFSDEFVAHATQTSQGIKMPRANWDVLAKYAVPVPPARLLRPFLDFVTDVVAMMQNLLFKNRNLRETRDLLLPKLVSGEVDVSGAPSLES